MDRKKPLYRSVNTRTHGVRHGGGEDYRSSRRREGRVHAGAMGGRQRHGLDYTPLFKFLLLRVGDDWDIVHAEAIARLDRAEPIFWMVARSQAEGEPFVCMGGSAYYSGLFVDDDNRLQRVDPALSVEQMEPDCACCTHTFNGVLFTRKYRPPAD